jgi:hypothetical protein
MNSASVELVVRARDEASAVLNKIKGVANNVGGSIGTALKSGGLLAAGGIGAATFALVKFTKAAAEDAASQAKLEQAVRNTGEAHRDLGAVFDNTVKSAMQLAFSDDQARNSLALLTAQTGSTAEAQRRFALAMDLSRGANIDLETASKLLGKVTADNVSVLSRYGIQVREGASDTELFAAVQQKFGGQAAVFADTATGKWQRFNIAMGEIKESIGAIFLPLATALAGVLLTHVVPAMESATTHLSNFIGAIQAFLSGDSARAIAFFNELPGPLQAVALWLAENRDGIMAFLQGARGAGEVIGGILLDALQGWLKIVQELGPHLVRLAQYIADHRPLLIAVAIAFGLVAVAIIGIPALIVALIIGIGLLADKWDEIKAKTIEIWESIKAYLNDNFAALVLIATFYFNIIKNQIETAINIVRDIINIVTALIRGDWSAAWEGVKQLANDIWQGIVDDILLKVGFLRDALALAWGVIKSIAETAFNEFRDMAGRVWDEVRGKVVDPVQKIIDKIKELIRTIKDIPKPSLDFSPGFDVPGVPGFQHGIAYVPRTMPAILHPGERVLTAQENRNYSSGGMSVQNMTIVLPNVYEPADFPRELDRYFRRGA